MLFIPTPDLQCTKCKEYFPNSLDYFPHDKKKKSKYRFFLSSLCRSCMSKASKVYHEENKEKTLAISNAWKDRNREHTRQYTRNYIQDNYAKVQEARYQWRRTEYARQKSIFYSHKRNMRLRELVWDFSEEQWDKCVTHFNSCCVYCGIECGRPELEHWIPITSPNCPGTIRCNVLPACKSCNNSKWNHSPLRWLLKKFGKQRAREIYQRIVDYF